MPKRRLTRTTLFLIIFGLPNAVLALLFGLSVFGLVPLAPTHVFGLWALFLMIGGILEIPLIDEFGEDGERDPDRE